VEGPGWRDVGNAVEGFRRRRRVAPREPREAREAARRSRGGGLRGGLELAIAELGDAPLGGLELLLEVLVLHLERVDRGDDLVEELVDLDLVVALAELDVLELLVEDVLSGEQGHFIAFRSYGLVAPRFLLQRSWTTEWGPPAYTSRE